MKDKIKAIEKKFRLFKYNMKKSSLPPKAQDLLSFDGVHYIDYIGNHVKQSKTVNYFEIGTFKGESLADISCNVIAVDPYFNLKAPSVGKKEKCFFFQQTSDDFFAENDPTYFFKAPIDTAFLDGMHLYEYLLRDFINTEKYCVQNSTIFLHDCLPLTGEMTDRVMVGKRLNILHRSKWTGDVWKVAAILLKYRPDLAMQFLQCPPTGLVKITNLDPKSTVLFDNYDAIIEEFKENDNDFEKLKEYLSKLTLTPTTHTS